MFERIRLFYEKRLWTAGMVLKAVNKGILTEEQYRQITGLPVEETEAVANG